MEEVERRRKKERKLSKIVIQKLTSRFDIFVKLKIYEKDLIFFYRKF